MSPEPTTIGDGRIRNAESGVVVLPPEPLEVYHIAHEFRVNAGGPDRFIKVRFSLGFAGENAALSAELAKRNSELRDMINLVLLRQSPAELATLEGLPGLRDELKASINHLLRNGRVRKVYFDDMIVNRANGSNNRANQTNRIGRLDSDPVRGREDHALH